MCVKNFFVILVVLTSVFCVSCVPVKTQKPKPQPKPQPKQGFLVKRSLGVSSAKQLDGASVCLIDGSKEEKLVRDYFKKNSLRNRIRDLPDKVKKYKLRSLYDKGRGCDAIVVDSNENVSSSDKFLPFE